MAHFDFVLETSTTEGTGNLTLAGAVVGHRTFASVYTPVTDAVYYGIVAVDADGVPTGEWELGLGALVDGTTLQRISVNASSTGVKVDFSAGTKRVYAAMSVAAVTAIVDDAVTAHVAASDPHGDRAYADELVAPLVFGAPGIYYGLPGMLVPVGLTVFATAAGWMVGAPLTCHSGLTVTKAVIEVYVARAGSSFEVVIYESTRGVDGGYTAGALVASLGTVNTATIGVKTITGLSVGLTKGAHYIVAAVMNVDGPTLRVMRYSRIGGMDWRGNNLTTTSLAYYRATGVSSPAPSTAPAMSAVEDTSAHYLITPVGLSWTTP